MKSFLLREKSILSGLYLSKFDTDGLKLLGFDNFTEAFNVIGLALGVKPMSIRNYRDEFDPLFSNPRKGWHKRDTRKYCKDIYNKFHHLDLLSFSALIKDIIYKYHDLDVLMEEIDKSANDEQSTFAKRLITGQAAEQYFRENFLSVDLFDGYNIEDTTNAGCGFDFKLTSKERDHYFGIEVKGLNGIGGNIALTNKEYAIANFLKDKYFIFVVKNFKEKPFHDIYQNPIENLNFKQTKNRIIQINWNTKV